MFIKPKIIKALEKKVKFIQELKKIIEPIVNLDKRQMKEIEKDGKIYQKVLSHLENSQLIAEEIIDSFKEGSFCSILLAEDLEPSLIWEINDKFIRSHIILEIINDSLEHIAKIDKEMKEVKRHFTRKGFTELQDLVMGNII